LFEHTANIAYRGETNRDYLHSILNTAIHKEETAIITKKSRLIAVLIQIFFRGWWKKVFFFAA
jgi:hypothetical protein